MTDSSPKVPLLPMRHVIRRTGLTADVLRAWERRHSVVTPERSEGGQRLYTERDVERLKLLHRCVLAGHSIGRIASLDEAELSRLLSETGGSVAPEVEVTTADFLAPLFGEAMRAVENMDQTALERLLRRAVLGAGARAVLDDLLPSLLRDIGDAWHQGVISAAHEHLASHVIRQTILWIMESYEVRGDAPRLLVATLSGEQHEMGAMFAATAAAEAGWTVFYPGPSLPASDIAATATRLGVQIVAVSGVYVGPSSSACEDLHTLAQSLDSAITLVAGGASIEACAPALDERVVVLPDIPAFRELLGSHAGAESVAA
jgi:MerR family transcriptional regulator, light-induced transcriptional regulator